MMTNEEAKAFLDNLKICIDEHPVVADWLVEIADHKTESNSGKPNNCEHITEEGVTCAKYPACDDCLDNPLNKVKGSERLVKGSEIPNNCEDEFFREPTAEERKAVADYIDSISVPTGVNIFDLMDEPTISKMEQVEDEPQADCGDFADRLAYERGVKHAWEVAQKVFNSTVTFYEAEDVAKQIDKDINVRSKDEPQIGEMMTEEEFDSMLARVLIGKDEPQIIKVGMATDSVTGKVLGVTLDTDCAWK